MSLSTFKIFWCFFVDLSCRNLVFSLIATSAYDRIFFNRKGIDIQFSYIDIRRIVNGGYFYRSIKTYLKEKYER